MNKDMDQICNLPTKDLSNPSSDENSDYELSADDEDPTPHDILENPSKPVDERCILVYSKSDQKNIKDEVLSSSKVLKFKSDWKFDEVLCQVKGMNSKDYPNLFIVIVESERDSITRINQQKLRKTLEKFCKNRPMILQITSKEENVSKFYFKILGRKKFSKISSSETSNDFPTFFWLFMNGKFERIVELMESLPEFENSSIICRFLRTLEINEDSFLYLMFKCAHSGSKNDIMALMNFPLYDEYGEISSSIEKYFTTDYYFDNEKESFLKNSIENNKDMHDFIIKCSSKMIGKFTFSFQVDISTAAFRKNQLDYLCDLIDICDFPFPKELDINAVTHERLKNIIEKRNKFGVAIAENNTQEINKFISEHPSLKFIYSPKNYSALHQVVDAKQFLLLGYLESLDFQSPEYNNYCQATANAGSKNVAKQFATRKRNENVKSAIPNRSKSVIFLSGRSFIHNRDIDKETEDEYRSFILKWLGNIYNDADNKPHLDLIAQCESLKIIFDFNSDVVKNIDPLSSESYGVMYPKSKWIFIGAKTIFENENRERNIQGILSHESYHYAMELRYENDAYPYYKFDKDTKEKFTKIVNDIKKWEKGSENEPDDECGGIISSVFREYEEEAYHPELIVRVVQILIEYADDKEKLAALEMKYKPLFDFHREHIIPDLKNFNLQSRENIRKFNNTAGQVEVIKNCNFEFSNIKDTSNIISNNVTVVSTNIPSLLLLNIYKNLENNFENVVHSKSIFVSIENMKNPYMLSELKEIIQNSSNLNIIVDCTNSFDATVKKLGLNENNFFTFIVSNDCQREKLSKWFTNVKSEEINYSWKDLTRSSQSKILQFVVDFLGNKIPAHKLYSKTDQSFEDANFAAPKTDEISSSNEKLPDKVDDELFKMLIEKSEISIGRNSTQNSKDAKYFDVLFQSRKFLRRKKSKKPKFVINKRKAEKKEKIFLSTMSLDELTEDLSKQQNNKKAETETEELEMTENELLKAVKNKKYILISDQAGTGKSWIIRSLSNIKLKMCPDIWTALVDLKQFVKEFKSAEGSAVIFSKFMVENILKLNTSYEKEVFYNLYENGKVCIFFDGFDEVAPNYTETVKDLIKSFESNGDNQLWISTRDYFQVDLEEELNLDEVYKIQPFKDEDGIKLIASILILHDLESSNQLKIEENLQQQVKNHPQYAALQQKAIELNKKISGLDNKTIGFPHLFQMIGDVYKNRTISEVQLTIYKIFEEFVKLHYDKWSSQKGIIRKNASTLSQLLDLNYMRLHQFFAMKGTYPDENKFCDLVFNSKQWSEEEIIACGLLVKKGDTFHFQHETFREFFIAQFLLSILRKDSKNANKEIHKYMNDILLEPKFGIVRMFMHDALNQHEISDQMIATIAVNMEKLDFFLDISKNCLEKLENMWIKYFRSLSYEKLKAILFNDKNSILSIAEDKNLCLKFKNFPHAMLNAFDLNELMQHKNKNNDNFIHICIRENEFESIKNVVEELRNKFGIVQFYEILKSKGNFGQNLLHAAARYSKEKNVFEYIWNLIKRSCQSNEFVAFLKDRDANDCNVFHVSAAYSTQEIFQFMIENLEMHEESDELMRLLMSRGDHNQNLLQTAVKNNNSVELLEYLWKIMRYNFSPKELIYMIQDKDREGNNLLHNVILNENSQLIEQTWMEIQKTANFIVNEQDRSACLEKCLKSKEACDRNLLHSAAYYSKDKKVHEYLWNQLRNMCKSIMEFVEILKEVDGTGKNVFHAAASSTSSQVLNFMVEELEKLLSKDDLKDLLKITGPDGSNLLQIAAQNNDLLEFHENLWKVLQNFFNLNEILEMITYNDGNGNNLLHNAFIGRKIKIIENTWIQIQNIADMCGEALKKKDFFEEILMSRGLNGRNLLQCALCITKDNEIHEYLWNLLTIFCDSSKVLLQFVLHVDACGNNVFHNAASNTSGQIFKFMIGELQNYISKDNTIELLAKTSSDKHNILHTAVINNNSLEFHKFLWKILTDLFNPLKMLEMITYADGNGNNLFHNAILGGSLKIIEHTWIQIRHIADSCSNLKNKTAFQEIILISKGFKGRNLLQYAAYISKEKGIHEYLWNLMTNFYKSKEYSFMQFLFDVDDFGDNAFHNAASFSTAEIFTFMIEELEKVLLSKDVKEILTSIGCNERNLLQSAVNNNISLEFHKCLWNIMRKYFNQSEMLRIIKQKNVNGNNLLHFCIINNNFEIIEQTWIEIQKTIEKNKSIQLRKLLKSTGNSKRNLLHIAVCCTIDIKTFAFLWNLVKNSFKFNEFVEFLKNVDSDGYSVLHLAALFTTSEIFNFMINELEKFTSENVIRELLKSKREGESKLLQTATKPNQSLKHHESLWKIMRKYFTSMEILEMISYSDEYNNNLFFYAVLSDNAKIIEQTWEEIQKTIESCTEKRDKSVQLEEFLKIKEYHGRNLLQYATCNTKNKATHECLWKLIQNYFDNPEKFLEYAMETDDSKNNILHNAVCFGTSQIFNFIIDEIQNLTSREYIRNYLKFKGDKERNLLQIAASKNQSLEFHECLWNTLRNCLNPIELMEMAIQIDIGGRDAFNLVIIFGNKATSKLMWSEISKPASLISSKMAVTIEECNFHVNSFLENFAKRKAKENVIEIWKESQKKMELEISFWISNKILSNEISVTTIDILHKTTLNSSKEFHEKLWGIFVTDEVKRKGDLMTLLMETNQDGNNFLHLLVRRNNLEIIEFTLNKCEGVLGTDKYNKILKAKGQLGQNLLQISLANSKDVKLQHFLWTSLQNSFDNQNEFLLLLKNADQKMQNVIHTAVSSSTCEIFEHLISKIAAIADVKKLLILKGEYDRNLLQCAASQNKSLELHKSLWKIIQEHFDDNAILQMINYYDLNCGNLLHVAVCYNTKNTVEFTWTQIKKYIKTKKDQTEYLRKKGHKEKNLMELSFKNMSKDSEVKVFMESLINENDINFEFTSNSLKLIRKESCKNS